MTMKYSSAGSRSIATSTTQSMGKGERGPWGLNWPIMFPIVLRRKRTGIVGIRNATNNTTGRTKMAAWRRSCLRISSLEWKSENGFMGEGSGSVELYIRNIFDLELLLGLALFGVEDQQAFEGSAVLENQVNLLIPHSRLRQVGERRGPGRIGRARGRE